MLYSSYKTQIERFAQFFLNGLQETLNTMLGYHNTKEVFVVQGMFS